MAETTVQTMMLPVALTHEEVFVRSQELSAAVSEGEKKSAELETFVEQSKATKKRLETEVEVLSLRVRHLATVVRSAREDRPVEIRRDYDYVAGKVETVRLDTGEIVGTRGLTDEERQLAFREGS
jgi:hypothetical protein